MVLLTMVTWDRLNYTKQAIQSVMGQTHQDFRLHIVDNGSTDGTPEYLKTLTDPRIQVTLWPENRGLSEATNFAWKGESKYVGRIDNDAYAESTLLERLVNAHERIENLGFLGGCHFTQKNLENIKPRIETINGIDIWQKKYIGGCAFIIKRADYDRFGEIASGDHFQGKVMGLTDYQVKFSDAGKINGYLWNPPSWVSHMEHIDSPYNICNEEYNNFTLRVRGLGVRDYSSDFDERSKPYLQENTLDN